MSRSITTPIKTFRPKITVNRSPSPGHRGKLNLRSDFSTIIALINILGDLPPVSDPEWYLYGEDDYIGIIDALDIHSIYTAEINKVASDTR